MQTCSSRILQRDRPEETEIGLGYHTQLHELHDAWLENVPNSTFVDARQHGDSVARDVLKIIETHLLLSTIPAAAGPAMIDTAIRNAPPTPQDSQPTLDAEMMGNLTRTMKTIREPVCHRRLQIHEPFW